MNKKWIQKVLFFTVLLLFTIGIFNFIIDPLQQYRAATFYKPHFTNARYLNPGLAKSYNYKSVIAGSSMTENFIISEVSSILNYPKPIKFSSGGTTAYELKLILELALKKKDIHNVLYGLDLYAFSGKTNKLLLGDNSLPLYLYDENYLNDYRYLLNIDTIKKSLKTLLLQNSKSTELDYNKMYQWQHRYKQDDFNKSEISDMWNSPGARFNKHFKKSDLSLEKLKNSFDSNLLSVIKNNPDTKFDIFYPPYSILTHVDTVDNELFMNNLKFKEYVFDRLSEYTNVKIYDFQIAKEITHNLNNYRDFSHYHQKVSQWILEQFQEDKYLVNYQTVTLFNDILKEDVESYILKNNSVLQVNIHDSNKE